MKKFFLTLLFFAFVFLLKTTDSSAAEAIQAWSSTTSLQNQLASHASESYNGKVYVFGGATSAVIPTNISSLVSNDGSLGQWISSALPISRYWISSARNNNNVYILGGATYPPTNSVDTVYLGSINGLGEIPLWQAINSLPERLSLGASAIVGDKIYYAGGFTETNGGGSSNVNDQIYFSSINIDGTVGNWSLAGSLPQPMTGFGMVADGNHLIVIGGANASNANLSTVYKTMVNPDGTIGPWQQTAQLPEPLYRASVVKINSDILSSARPMALTIGGRNGSNDFLNKVYYATINADGTVGNWQLSQNNLPRPFCCAAATIAGSYIYSTGGHDGGYLSNVYYTKIGGEAVLDVPLLKQTSEPWQSQEYDTAHLWSPLNPTINRWGCAMTSAAMVFKYHGINKLPNGTNLDPGTLNTWLNSQNDGYVRQGWVNWLALSRLSKLATNINNITEFDALEYKRKHGADKNLLTTDITNGNPGILEEPGHFIVAKGIDGETFSINDPFYNRETLNDGYSNTFLSLGRFVPSNTDLSYIMIVADADVTLELLDINDNVIAESFVQQPIIDPTDPQSENEPVSILYAPQPETGNYKIVAQSNGNNVSEITFYLYDNEGNVTISDQQILKTTNFDVNYDKNSSDNEDPEKIVSFQSVIDDIRTIDNNNQVNHGLATGMVALIGQSEREYNRGDRKNALKFVNLAEKLLNISHKLLANDQAYQLLLDDLSALKNLINS